MCKAKDLDQIHLVGNNIFEYTNEINVSNTLEIILRIQQENDNLCINYNKTLKRIPKKTLSKEALTFFPYEIKRTSKVLILTIISKDADHLYL